MVLNEAPSNDEVTRVANIMLSEVPNSNDVTRVMNNARLTIIRAQRYSMEVI